MLRAELNGESAPELVTAKTELEFTATTYAVRYAGNVMDNGTYELGPEANPQNLVLRSIAGTNSGREIPCIYQLKGNRLRISFGIEGGSPLAFSAPLRGSYYCAVYGLKQPVN